ncbi:unnamed protein product [Bathycoccus prasinos]
MGGNFPLVETGFNVAASSALLFAGTSHAILQRPSILSILFLFVFAAERISGSQNRVLTQEIVRTRRQIIWWAALGLAIFWNARRARRTDFLHSI